MVGNGERSGKLHACFEKGLFDGDVSDRIVPGVLRAISQDWRHEQWVCGHCGSTCCCPG